MTGRNIYGLSPEERRERLKPGWGQKRRRRLERTAAEMQQKYLTPRRKGQIARRDSEFRQRATAEGGKA